jgi:hypothetical protein
MPQRDLHSPLENDAAPHSDATRPPDEVVPFDEARWQRWREGGRLADVALGRTLRIAVMGGVAALAAGVALWLAR